MGRIVPGGPYDRLGRRRAICVVTGTRSWDYPQELIRRRLHSLPPASLVLHGAAVGVDLLAAAIAEELGHHPFPVPYAGSLGKAGGPARNSAMIKAAHHLGIGDGVVVVEGFHRELAAMGPGSGTRDCLLYAAAKPEWFLHVALTFSVGGVTAYAPEFAPILREVGR